MTGDKERKGAGFWEGGNGEWKSALRGKKNRGCRRRQLNDKIIGLGGRRNGNWLKLRILLNRSASKRKKPTAD